MSTTTTSPPDPAQGPATASRSWVNHASGARSRVIVPGGRRRVSYLVAGVLLVVVCTAGVVLTVARVGERIPVLVLARPVVVGQVLAPGDLRQISMNADPGTDVLPADQTRAVVGRPVAYSLPGGTLLSRAALGTPQIPPPGQAVVAIAVQPGQFPPELGAGTTVSVIRVPGTGSTDQSPGGPWTAVVSAVTATASAQTTVISLQLPTQSARQVAAISPGQLNIVAESAGGR